MRKTIFVVVALALAGCTTQAPRPDQVDSAPAEHVTAFQSPNDGDATILITRDLGFTGKGCSAALFMDGRQVGRLDTGERATFHVPAGEHIVGTSRLGAALCSPGNDRTELTTIVRAGETKKFRVRIDGGAEAFQIMPTTL